MLSPILESFHRRFSNHVGGPEEHDAQEFLLFLLDKIESELMLIKAHVRGHEGRPFFGQIQSMDPELDIYWVILDC